MGNAVQSIPDLYVILYGFVQGYEALYNIYLFYNILDNIFYIIFDNMLTLIMISFITNYCGNKDDNVEQIKK